MSDELMPENDDTLAYDGNAEDEYEEISSEEVDRVVAALEELIETVESENVRVQLEDALNSVYYLVYDDSDDVEELDEAA